jgi:hypothetical protein
MIENKVVKWRKLSLFLSVRSVHGLEFGHEVEFSLDTFGEIGRCDVLFGSDNAHSIGDVRNIILFGLLFLILILVF